MNSDQNHDKKNLREGFTTGTATAVAAHAAVLRLLGQEPPSPVCVTLPPFALEDTLRPEGTERLSLAIEASGTDAHFPPLQNIDQITPDATPSATTQNGAATPDATQIATHTLAATPDTAPPTGAQRDIATPTAPQSDAAPLTATQTDIPPSATAPSSSPDKAVPDYAWASIIKDGGDDPDATHKARIIVYASFAPLPSETLEKIGPVQEARRAVTLPGEPKVVLHGLQGVGVATLPGLPVKKGEPAINPEPRKQITYAVREALAAHGCSCPVYVYVVVPEGEKISKNTLNPRLGIVGGISILGTRGTVRPYSHAAWTATIEQSLCVAEALGLDEILFTTGRRSERLGLSILPHLSKQSAVQVADYAAFSVRAAAAHKFRTVHWVCFPGKLLKLAQGLEYTHARSGEADISLLARYCREAGGGKALEDAVAAMPTAVGAFGLMEEDKTLCAAVLERLARKAYKTLNEWLTQGAEGIKQLPPIEGSRGNHFPLQGVGQSPTLKLTQHELTQGLAQCDKTGHHPELCLYVCSLEGEQILLRLCSAETSIHG